MKLHQGEFTPKNPTKYKGTYPIVYRSGWEKKMMLWLDSNPNVLHWSSESIIVPYYHPIKKRMARYYPDFFATIKDKDGNITRYLIEIKPLKETIVPNIGNKKGKTRLYEELTYVINDAKWNAAKEFCKTNGLKFQIITEKELYKYK